MTGTEKSDRSGGPSCEARTDRYVILNGAGVLVSGPRTLGVSLRELDNIKALPITYPNFPYTIHAVGPALTFARTTIHAVGPALTFESPEEERARKLEELVDLMAPHDGPTSYIGDAYDLAAELLASREAGQ